MDESQLERMLFRGACRLRLNAALRWCCAAVLSGAFAAAVAVLMARFIPSLASGLLAVSWLSAPLVLTMAVAGFLRCRPAPGEVALRFDRAAGLQEHVTTWEEIRRRGLPGDAVARTFALLQRAATLRIAAGIRPARLLPLVLPVWSRGLWLALLFLGCAILVPEQRGAVGRLSGAAVDGQGEEGGGATTSKPLPPERLTEVLTRIEILSPPEKEKYRIAAYGQDVPESLKAEALKGIEAKVGGLSEAELSADVRELLAELRRQVHGNEAVAKPGTSTAQGGGPDGSGPVAKPETGANALTPQEALALARAQFPDVAVALHRYYFAE